MTDREPFTGADNAWRRLGTVDNLTTITGVLSFDSTVGYEEFCDRLKERLLRFERFTQSPKGRKRRLRMPYWETQDDFDVETHVTEMSLAEPGDKETFQRFVSKLMSRPLDERRPLWEAFLVDDAGAGDGNAAVFRINHSIGDGFALMYVLLGLIDDPDGIDLPGGIVPDPPSPEEFTDRSVRANGGSLEDRDTVEATDGGMTATAESEEEPSGTAEPRTDRDEDSAAEKDDSGVSLAGGGLLDTLSLGAKGVTTAWNLLTLEDEVDTSLRGDIGTAKRAGWTSKLDLEEIKAVGRPHDATVNDVLLAALAGGFRRLLSERGENVDEIDELRVTVPVNLKPMSERDASLGNYFGLVFVPLPVGTPDLGDRIDIINERMDKQKAGIEAFLMYLTLEFGGRAPDPVFRWLLRQFEDQATGVVTNVPGPTDTMEFAGHEVSDLLFWVPQANDQGIGISIGSYDGSVRLGIAADANLIEDPQEFSDAVEAEIAELVADLD